LHVGQNGQDLIRAFQLLIPPNSVLIIEGEFISSLTIIYYSIIEGTFQFVQYQKTLFDAVTVENNWTLPFEIDYGPLTINYTSTFAYIYFK
jgi:hypothetical protein